MVIKKKMRMKNKMIKILMTRTVMNKKNQLMIRLMIKMIIKVMEKIKILVKIKINLIQILEMM